MEAVNAASSAWHFACSSPSCVILGAAFPVFFLFFFFAHGPHLMCLALQKEQNGGKESDAGNKGFTRTFKGEDTHAQKLSCLGLCRLYFSPSKSSFSTCKSLVGVR
jgi:hypothetical protein